MHVEAAVIASRGATPTVTRVELDAPREDEVRVRMVASGVCHTDAIIRDQVYPTPLPAVLGHEGAGVVELVGSAVTRVSVGDHVLLSANSCGQCTPCLSGSPAYCADLFARNFGGRRPDGSTSFTDDQGQTVSSHFFGQSSFASYANVAERSLVKIDPDVDLTLVAPLGCGIQTGAGAVLNELQPALGSTFAVFGAGAVGAGAIMAAVIAGCSRIVAVDINDSRLDLARELGATDVINSRTEDVADRLDVITGGAGLDFALDTTGRPEVLRAAADALGTRGAVALVGASLPGTEVSFEIGESLNKGWSFRTIIQGSSVPQVFIPQLIGLWQQGRFPFDKIIRHYRLSDIATAFADSEQGRTVKPVLVF
ncbi:NAD(P)-dependent alcohol dehydrogenase [Amycolatopsis viridis]|uniref:Aryl-alcohol dehydrogenase n=1 Tax=Amycolatopsis viridis TaxID=185678 RepID=A0ABX0SU42_9PSEU|nr:NAD(P)-dependent alcohol dehydrogenase [Amycolatopsis viridis]NIH78890.1 aryl-alcohol dehydrogenase [Amycolatopsis viridis]